MICKWRIFVFFCCRAAGSEQQVIECFCQRSLLLRLVVVHWLSQYFRLGGRSVIFHRLAQLQGFFGLALAGLRCPCVQLLPEIQQLARRLAAEMGYIYVDTGAMYRAIGLYALRAGKDPKDNAAVNALLPQIELRLASIEGEQHIYLKEEDVSTAIRTEAAGMAASAVGANPAVRAFLLELQRDMAKKQDVLMDGRDIGTVVLPDATVKIFLTATPEARATRRWKEYQAKGIDTPYEEVLADVKQRDYQDTHRAAAPLKRADDAVLLDTSELDFEQSLAAMKKIIAEKVKN